MPKITGARTLTLMSATSRKSLYLLAIVAVISSPVLPYACAQIIMLQEYRGHEIACSQSGLHGFSSRCGADEGYAQVFTGSVLSVTEVSANERALLVQPEEIFFGTPADRVSVTTAEAGCLPDMQAGDKWLFYLRKEPKSDRMSLEYGSPSGPIEDRNADIALLRSLASMSGSGLIKGDVSKGDPDEDGSVLYTSISNHKIVATSAKDGETYTASTDAEGSFQFEPLPSGTYNLSSNTVPGQWAEEGTVEVSPHSCDRVNFELVPDGGISGHIRTSSGSPAKSIEITILAGDEERPDARTTFTNDDGYFEVRGLKPDRYLAGIGIYPGDSDHKQAIYFPGVTDRAAASVIEIGPAEKRKNVDIDLPAIQGGQEP
jgi:hypothetical protein